VNANDATLAELATAQSGSMVRDDAPNAPARDGFDLIVAAATGHALRFVATLVSPGAQIVAIGHSDPFVLV